MNAFNIAQVFHLRRPPLQVKCQKKELLTHSTEEYNTLLSKKPVCIHLFWGIYFDS